MAIPAALAERPDPLLDEIGYDLIEVGARDATPVLAEPDDAPAEDVVVAVEDVVDVAADVPAVPTEVVEAVLEPVEVEDGAPEAQ
jgi:hypothetical protein